MPRRQNALLLLQCVALLLPMAAITALVDWRLFGQGAAAATALVMAATFVVAVAPLALSRCIPAMGSTYWPVTVATIVLLLGIDALGFVGAMHAGLRFVSGPQYIAIALCIKTVVGRCGLRPEKAWTLVVVGFAPLLLQPIALLFPRTWEAAHPRNFACYFAFEVFACGIFVLQTMLGSYRETAAGRAARIAQQEVIADAALSLAVLETSMPPCIAQALVEGAAPESLGKSFAAASIAFIGLDDFRDVGTSDPKEFFSRLDRIYTAFDSLVTVFGRGVNKIETYGHTYVVAVGVPEDSVDHAALLCCFCADILALCGNLTGVGRIRVRIGINSGPVSAGFIGRSRCFFRICGDTGAFGASTINSESESVRIHMGFLSNILCAVNVASRMMSTGSEGLIQCSPTTVEAMTALAGSIGELNNALGERRLALRPRGSVDVKGKGPMLTHWLELLDSPDDILDGLSSDVAAIGLPGIAEAALEGQQRRASLPIMQSTVDVGAGVRPSPVVPPASSNTGTSGPSEHLSAGTVTSVESLGFFDSTLAPPTRRAGSGAFRMVSSFASSAANLAFAAQQASSASGSLSAANHPFRMPSELLPFDRVSKRVMSMAELRAPHVLRSRVTRAIGDELADMIVDATMDSSGIVPQVQVRPPTTGDPQSLVPPSAGDPRALIPSQPLVLPIGVPSGQTSLEAVSNPPIALHSIQAGLPPIYEAVASLPSSSALGDQADQPSVSHSKSKVPVFGLPPLDPAYIRTANTNAPHAMSARITDPDVQSMAVRFVAQTMTAGAGVSPQFRRETTDPETRRVATHASSGRRSDRESASGPASPVAESTLSHNTATSHTVAISVDAEIHARELPALGVNAGDLYIPRSETPSRPNATASAPSASCWIQYLVPSLPRFKGDAESRMVSLLLYNYVSAGPGVLLVIAVTFGVCAGLFWPITSSFIVVMYVCAIACLNVLTALLFQRACHGWDGAAQSSKLSVARQLTLVYIADYGALVGLCAILLTQFTHEWLADLPRGRGDEQEFLWIVAFLALLGSSLTVSRVPFQHALVFWVVSSSIDVIQASLLAPSVDVAAMAVAALFVFRAVGVSTSFVAEGHLRVETAAQLAATVAAADAKALIRDLFPTDVVTSLKQGHGVAPTRHSGVAVLYADIAGFTRMASTLPSDTLMRVVDAVYTRFDTIVEEMGLWKVDTVGDAYIIVDGINDSESTNIGGRSPRDRVDRMMRLAVRLQQEMGVLRSRFELPLNLRIGIDSGDVFTGIMGTLRMHYYVLGAAMSGAEHAQEHATPGCVACTEAAQNIYASAMFTFSERRVSPHGLGQSVTVAAVGRAGQDDHDAPSRAASATVVNGSFTRIYDVMTPRSPMPDISATPRLSVPASSSSCPSR